MKTIKTLVSTFLIMTCIVTLLTACFKSPQPKIWDGTVAESFSGGNGQKDAPFEISTPAELAYLAKSVNEGNEYQEQYFILKNDLDLVNISWTPIGNGNHPFMGNFDGKGHTIKNLKISQSARYTYAYPTGKEAVYSDTGLFATIQDASIQNLVIDGTTIVVADTNPAYLHNAGVLCGTVRTYQKSSVVSNIDIKNAKVTAEVTAKGYLQKLCVGGLVGYIYAYNNTTTTISLVEADSSIFCADSLSSDNYMGSVLGVLHLKDATFTLENGVAYQTLTPNLYQYYYTVSDNFCGAIGSAQASAQPFTVKNVFSKLTINKPDLEGNKYLDQAIVANAIIGDSYYHALKDDPDAVGYKFENVFGCVEHIDAKTGKKTITTELYELPEGPDFAQINCQGCEALPENHGFDTNIWDISDVSNPKLK